MDSKLKDWMEKKIPERRMKRQRNKKENLRGNKVGGVEVDIK